MQVNSYARTKKLCALYLKMREEQLRNKDIAELARLSKFDMADYLKTDSAIKEYLEVVIKEDDPAAFLEALHTIARAKSFGCRLVLQKNESSCA